MLESHRGAAVAGAADGAGKIEQLATSLAESMARLKAFDAADVDRFARAAQLQLARAAAILDERARSGCVRRCHGDLHLGNIVLWGGRPLLFDAIEFDEAIATVDTLYDLAFLLMDLDRHRQRTAANVVLNRYLWRDGADLSLRGLQALPLFLGCRAGIRAMVTADRAAQEQDTAAAQADRETARGYLRAALEYLQPAPPRLVAIGGLSGTGKTTLAAALAPELGSAPGAVHVRSDLERKALFGVEETVRLPAQSYTAQASAEVYAIVLRKARLALAAGQSVVRRCRLCRARGAIGGGRPCRRARRDLPGLVADRACGHAGRPRRCAPRGRLGCDLAGAPPTAHVAARGAVAGLDDARCRWKRAGGPPPRCVRPGYGRPSCAIANLRLHVLSESRSIENRRWRIFFRSTIGAAIPAYIRIDDIVYPRYVIG